MSRTKHGFDTLKVHRHRICSCAILLLCAACSREPDDEVGQQISESLEPDTRQEEWYAVYASEFKGKGPAHTMSDIEKYGLDHS